MTRGAIISAILHLAVALFVMFGLPSWFDPDLATERAIAVTIYTIGEETTLPTLTPDPTPESPAAVPEPDAPRDFVAPQPAEVSEPAPPELPPPPVKEVKPEPPKPEPAPPPPLKEIVKAEPPPPKEIVKVEPPQPAPPPPPKPPAEAPVVPATVEAPPTPLKKPPAPPDQFASLLKSIEQEPRDQAETPAPRKTAAVTEPVASRLPSVSDKPLSTSVLDAIRGQIESNWNVPIGVPDADQIVVEISISLERDGTVRVAKIADSQGPGGGDQAFVRSMAESALRAVYRSSPLQGLPRDQYEKWKEITFTFRPPA